MAVHSVRLIGARASGATSEALTVGTSSGTTSRSGQARTNAVTIAEITTTEVMTVLTATAPIQCPCVRSKTSPQVGHAVRIRIQSRP